MTELDEIEEDYKAGRLDDIRRDLDAFIVAHRARIEAFRAEQQERGLLALPDDVAIKFYIIRQRSINPAREILDQVKEIEREKWIRGIETGCSPDPQEVCLDWARNHSAGWRAHRVTTIIYCFDQERDRFLRLFRDGAGTDHTARPA
jgi:hypothetical protein